MDVITVTELTKRYGETLAVDGVSFAVPQGGTLGLLGGNGAGKTTTIAMLLGLLIPPAVPGGAHPWRADFDWRVR
jgi:ABC-2 type transport system ATP-binding protein